MAIATASMTVAAGVQPLHAVSTSSHSHFASAASLGGIRVNNVAHAGVGLRMAGRTSTLVVRAETDKVQGAADGASREVQKAAGGFKGILEGLGNFFAGKKNQAQEASRDAQKRAQSLGEQAADAGRDLEGSARNAASNVSSQAQKLGEKAESAVEDAGDKLKSNFDKSTSSAQESSKDLQKKAEDAADAAKDTASDLKRDAQKGVDRVSN